MAKSKTIFSFPFIPFALITFLFSILAATAQPPFSVTGTAPPLDPRREKLSKLHFFFHDIQSGPKPTAVRVAQAQMTDKSPTSFGFVEVADDPLTIGPEPGSKVVGRAQGIYASASQQEIGFAMVFNFVFTEGIFNGSTLSLLGRNAALSGIREMPIVGGSRAFRFARGYAKAKTYSANFTSGDAVVEYNVYVLHY